MTTKEIEKAINKSLSMAEAARKLNLPFMTFKRLAIRLGLYKTNSSGKDINKGGIPLSEILDGKHPEYKNSELRHRLIRAGIIEDKCSQCGWEEKRKGCRYSTCELHHKNGDSHDHRRENLDSLCPNCHSLTPTYCKKGRNKSPSTP